MSLSTLIFRPDEFYRYYNCSAYDYNIIPYEERRNVAHAVIIFLSGLLIEIFYLPCLFALYRIMRRKNESACYSYMLYLAVVECVSVLYSTFASAHITFEGIVYCQCPVYVYVSCQLCMGLWFAESSVTVILALNRCLTSVDGRLAEKYFSKRYRWAWLSVPTIGAIMFPFSTPPNIYNPIDSSIFYNPHNHYLPNDKYYHSSFNILYNWMLIITLLLIYAVFIAITFSKLKEHWGDTHGIRRNRQKLQLELRITLQVFVTCFLVLVTSLAFLYMEHISQYAFIMMLSYIFYQGSPAFIYLCLNVSIRSEVRCSLLQCIPKKINNQTSTFHSQTWKSHINRPDKYVLRKY